MKRTFLFLLFFIGLLNSCTKFTTRMRIKPEISYENGVLISNSQTNPYKFVLNEKGDLVIDYKVIVKNTLDKLVDINLEQAYYKAGDEQKPLDCKSHQGNLKNINLKKEEQAGIECSAIVTPNSVNKLKLNDTDIKLILSFNNKPYSFNYRVFAEEFAR